MKSEAFGGPWWVAALFALGTWAAVGFDLLVRGPGEPLSVVPPLALAAALCAFMGLQQGIPSDPSERRQRWHLLVLLAPWVGVLAAFQLRRHFWLNVPFSTRRQPWEIEMGWLLMLLPFGMLNFFASSVSSERKPLTTPRFRSVVLALVCASAPLVGLGWHRRATGTDFEHFREGIHRVAEVPRGVPGLRLVPQGDERGLCDLVEESPAGPTALVEYGVRCDQPLALWIDAQGRVLFPSRTRRGVLVDARTGAILEDRLTNLPVRLAPPDGWMLTASAGWIIALALLWSTRRPFKTAGWREGRLDANSRQILLSDGDVCPCPSRDVPAGAVIVRRAAPLPAGMYRESGAATLEVLPGTLTERTEVPRDPLYAALVMLLAAVSPLVACAVGRLLF